MTDLEGLAKRVETLTGPCRETDRDIEIAIQNLHGRGYEDPRHNIRAQRVSISHGAKPHNYEVVAFSGISLMTPREYTASIDAAMTLVPDGWVFSIDTLDGYAEAVVGNEKRAIVQADYVRAATPALALCAAALRAQKGD